MTQKDSYATLLMHIKDKEVKDEDNGQGKISFEDYEKLMKMIEQEPQFERIEAENPRAKAYADERKKKRVQEELELLHHNNFPK